MSIDIASPGGFDAALRAALHALVPSMVLVSSGSVGTGKYFEVTIPAVVDTNERLILNLNNLCCDTLETFGLVCFMSFNGGSSWLEAADSYIDSTDKVCYLTDHEVPVAPNALNAQISIFPGNATVLTKVHTICTASSPDDIESITLANGVNSGAIVPPTPARVTTLRIMPAGNFDNPPTSDRVFTNGYWYLYR